MVVEDKKLTRRSYPSFAEGYKLLECVGKGSEGSVWRALCIPNKKEVAIKIIDLECLPVYALEELREQIHMMYLCSMHPHIVRYYTSFVYNQSLWCVMKYLSGGSCSDIMRFGHPNGLDEAAIKIILKDTLKALVYFHANGRIHRDIKAGNIIISENGQVQVADFGVSGSLIEQLRTTLCGSPCWMAPEVMLRAWPEGRAKSEGYDSAVDIWSLGITALELAKGRPPFAECAPSRVFSMVVKNPPPALEDQATKRKFSSQFKDFVSFCLQKDPKNRPSAAKLLKHKFFRGKKSREYLVNSVLSQVPPAKERAAMIVDAVPPILHSQSPMDISWDFGEGTDGESAFANSYESTNYLHSSCLSQLGHSFGASTITDGSSLNNSFLDDLLAPTPANTMNEKREEFNAEDFVAPTPANTMNEKREEFIHEYYDDAEFGVVQPSQE